jgi:hypothetical protein
VQAGIRVMESPDIEKLSDGEVQKEEHINS